MVPEIPSRGNYSLEEPRPEKSVELNEGVLQTLVENPIVTDEELAEKLGFGHSTIYQHLCAIEKVSKLD